jgi:hypothetical protein
MPKATRKTTKTSQKMPVKQGTSISKSQVVKYLAKVSDDKVFWCCDGSILRDIKELQDALARMSDQTFAYHCNDIKKDFSNWVRDVLGDEKLATDLETVLNREQAFSVVEEHCCLLLSKGN